MRTAEVAHGACHPPRRVHPGCCPRKQYRTPRAFEPANARSQTVKARARVRKDLLFRWRSPIWMEVFFLEPFSALCPRRNERLHVDPGRSVLHTARPETLRPRSVWWRGTMGEVATALVAFDDAFARCLGALRGPDAVRACFFSSQKKSLSPSKRARP